MLDCTVRVVFQPIVDVAARSVYAYEALVRGEDGNFQPHLIKPDMALIRDIDRSAARRHIVGGIVAVATHLGLQSAGARRENAGRVPHAARAGHRSLPGLSVRQTGAGRPGENR